MTKCIRSSLVIFSFLLANTSAADEWYSYPVEVWDPPFDLESPRKSLDYVPLDRATRKWNIHVFFPHMKDIYWLAVNFGIASDAKKLGVQMSLKHAGGYENLDVQIRQIRESLESKPDGIIISSVSYTGLDSVIAEISDAGIPVVDLVNGVASRRIAAKCLVYYGDMGYMAGEYLAKRHPKGSKPVKVAWFPGPADAFWVQSGDKGFREGVKGSAVRIVDTRFGDTGKVVQRKLIEGALDQHPDVDYLVCTTVGAEAAPRILRRRGLSERVKVLSCYLSPGVHRGIKRGQILAAPVDPAVIQGRIAIDQMVRILEGKEYQKHVGPTPNIVDRSNIDSFDTSPSLAPSGFRATYTVN